MSNNTKIINDPADLVPLLHVFKNDRYTEIFRQVFDGDVSQDELEEEFGKDAEEMLDLLNSIGLVKSHWSMNNGSPVKEYETSYSRFKANFECDLKEIVEILHISMLSDELFEKDQEALEGMIENGSEFISDLSEKLEQSEVLVRAMARRSDSVYIRGNKIERK
ncbi:ArsR family transcriptional regulator [Methanonatronarchaeum thermophilum]|uniref:ArsR family transcriptional regulator n=1 Tax=Methanonatronarchaeum thermophilum TaxID=1927129 RepID=A0A1Y3GDU5_9EURY|nr:ArsR family transcriptional regulator [Methanonatronarchaeum thermophilum]OUJ18483.1 ArsR family transcriptional regulator [Methanonatronarchaeum thermophilum]